MAGHKTHSVELKHRVVREYLAGETLHGLARRHNLPRNLIRIWVDKHLYPTQSSDLCEAPATNDIAELTHALHACEDRIDAIERLVAKRIREREMHGRTRPQEPQSPKDGD